MGDDWREVFAEWQGGEAFIGRNLQGGEVQMGTLDGKPGISPMEMLLLGVAGCSGTDIVSILKKKRQPLQAFQVKVRGKRADTYPRVYTEMHVTYTLWGDRIDPKAVEHAIHLSEGKYCSASIMMKTVCSFTSSYEIISSSHKVNT